MSTGFSSCRVLCLHPGRVALVCQSRGEQDDWPAQCPVLPNGQLNGFDDESDSATSIFSAAPAHTSGPAFPAKRQAKSNWSMRKCPAAVWDTSTAQKKRRMLTLTQRLSDLKTQDLQSDRTANWTKKWNVSLDENFKRELVADLWRMTQKVVWNSLSKTGTFLLIWDYSALLFLGVYWGRGAWLYGSFLKRQFRDKTFDKTVWGNEVVTPGRKEALQRLRSLFEDCPRCQRGSMCKQHFSTHRKLLLAFRSGRKGFPRPIPDNWFFSLQSWLNAPEKTQFPNTIPQLQTPAHLSQTFFLKSS